jgi:CHAT domain-containing protein/tetratricopeptide (TPR) repeat protein
MWRPWSLPATAVLLLALTLTGSAGAATPLNDDLLAPSVPRPAPRARPEIIAEPVLFTARSILYATHAENGSIVTVEKGDQGDELWLYPAGYPQTLPQRLLPGAARLTAPALSRDGRFLAWIDSRDDVKGDLWRLDLSRAGATPQRLSDSRSEESAPVFSRDGSYIVVHQLTPGSTQRRLVRYDRAAATPTFLPISIDAAFAHPAPDGYSWVFVSRSSDPNGDLWLWDGEKKLEQLTFGSDADLYPAWEGENTLLFTRLMENTARGEIVRLQLNRRDTAGRPRLFPLTAPALGALAPLPVGKEIYFVGAQPGGGQLLTLPASGEIPRLENPAAQWQLVQRLRLRRPVDIPLIRLACFQVLAQEEETSREGALASLTLIELLEEEGKERAALNLAEEVSRRYAGLTPESQLAALAGLRLEAQLRYRNAAAGEPGQRILATAVAALDAQAAGESPELRARVLIDGGRLLSDLGSRATDRLAALERLERASALPDLSRPLQAEAHFRRALLLTQLASGEGEAALISVVQNFPDEELWAERAVSVILEGRTPADGASAEPSRPLAVLAERYRQELPRLAMGAWNRIGDLAYAAEEWSRARDAYRTVLDSFPPLLTPTAAARFALAELLYREERYGEAAALYEVQMGEVPEETPIYQLARAAYIRKRLAAGESLYRRGEIAAARSTFLDLIRYEGRSLPAHRGYTKAVAAQGQAAELLLLYQKLLQQYPDDPILLYGAGLCETYLPGRDHLRNAGKVLQRAFERLPASPYPAQTLGYLAEVEETVYNEVGGLERALGLYRRAALLNREDIDPDNRANLDLNLGNVAFLLGRNATAQQHYQKRLAAHIPFDHPETELLFQRRAGAVAFQLGASQEAIARYSAALQLVEARLDPTRPLDAFGKLARRINERLFSPEKGAPPAPRAALTEQQAIATELDALGAAPPLAPPAAEWEKFSAALRALLQREERLIAAAMTWSPVGKTYQAELQSLRRRVSEELDAVPRLVETKAELHDRLGLASLEAGEFAAAGLHFTTAFDLNLRLGRTDNLVLNRRSGSIAAYQQAQSSQGEECKALLTTARSGFLDVLQLVKKYPPKTKKAESPGGGLISVKLDYALDQTSATSAAFGFSAEQEQRLAETYLARISAELGDPAAALATLRRQLARYPQEVAKVAPGDRFGLGLLSHRVAHLEHALADDVAAAADFRRALLVNLAEGSPFSAAINLRNWGALLDPQGAGVADDFLRRQAEVAALLTAQRPTLPSGSTDRFYLDSSALLLRLANAQENPLLRSALLYRALTLGDQTLALSREGEKAEERERLKLRAAALLNRAAVCSALGLDGAATAAYNEALAVAEAGQLPALRWRAEAGRGDYPAALELLHGLAPNNFDLQTGELFTRFAPELEKLAASDSSAALNRVEELSEIERVQLLAPPLLALDEPGVAETLRAAAPHLRLKRELQGQLSSARPVDRDYLQLRLQQEETLLAGILGKERVKLPPVYATLPPALLDYLAAALENGASREEVQPLRANFVSRCQAGEGGRFCSLLLPQTVELSQLDMLLEGREVLRPVALGNERWLLFILNSDGGVLSETLTTPQLQERVAASQGAILASEDQQLFKSGTFLTRALSLTHLWRSLEARQPFRQNILDPAGWWPIKPPFVQVQGTSLAETLPQAHTLVLPASAGLLIEPPLGVTGTAVPRFSYSTASGERHSLDLDAAVSLALVVAPHAGAKQAYALGHATSLAGVPSLLISAGTPAGPTFTASYAQASLSDAAAGLPAGWLLLGDWGLDAAAAQQLGRSRFAELGKAGLAAQQRGEHLQALAYFEDALAIAATDVKLTSQIIPLRRLARESAFAADKLERSIVHAAALVAEIEKSAPYSAAHADALLRYGLLCGRAERFTEAETALQESVATFADLGLVKEQAAALSGFAQVQENALDYSRAGILYSEAADLRQLLKDDLSLADQYRNLGRLYDLRLSRYAEAERYYAQAVDLYAVQGAKRLEGEALLERGRTRRLLGDFNGADALYEEALQKIGTGEEKSRARVTLEQANNAWFQGRYQESFEKRDKVEKAAKAGGWSGEIVMAKNTGGLIWSTLGDHKRALVELRAALVLAEELPGRQDEVATTLNNIGLVQRESGDPAAALTTLERALAIDKKIGSRWAMAYDLRNLGQCLLRLGRPEPALRHFDEAEGLATVIGDQVNLAKILLARADAELQLGRLTDAQRSYRQALAIADRLLLPEVRWRALYGLAQGEERAGKNNEAIDAYRQAIATIEELRATIRLDQLKDGFLNDKGDVYAGLVGLLAGLGRGDEAFEVAERSRARNLIDILGRQRLSLAGSVDQSLYDRQLQLKEGLREQEQFLLLAATPAEQALYQTALDQLRADYQDLLLEIERLRPELLALVKVDPLSLPQLRELLEPGIVLLSYYQLPDRVLCWRIDRQGATLFTLPVSAADLAASIATYRRMLQNLEPLEKLSTSLYAQLLAAPLKGAGEIRALGIIPHGSLHYLAFATLSDSRDFLVEQTPLFHLPAASVLRYTLERRSQEKNRKVLAIGNPDLGDKALDLPFAEREAATLRWNYPDLTLLTRERATESWVRTHIHEFGIIHLASHGEFDPINPLFSSVRLARDPANDGRLEAEEIFGLDLKADLVVLSACQTGLGDLQRGDDVVGMNRAFLFAGTHALLSSLWRVSDVATAIEMKQFYRDYGKLNKAEALRKAMLHVKGRYPHPGYWGAFVLTGDYE